VEESPGMAVVSTTLSLHSTTMKLVFIEQRCSLNTSFNNEESSSLKREV